VERLPMSAFTEALHNQAIDRIASYSVGLTGIDLQDGNEVPIQSGSATLVDLDGRLCLISADHAIENIARRDRVGLLIDWRGGLRRCVFEGDALHFVRLPRGPTEDAGPDLGAILLPPSGENIATLRAHKGFYNLGKRIERFDGNYLPLGDGVWIPCGVLGEGSVSLPPTETFATVTGHLAMMGISSAPIESVRDGFDYLDLEARMGDADVPRTFGGVSGGGLWQVQIARHREGGLEVHDVVFSGVLFYQSAVVDGRRRLRSHGRASVHERLATAIRVAFPRP
jgi:hypothetical protein